MGWQEGVSRGRMFKRSRYRPDLPAERRASTDIFKPPLCNTHIASASAFTAPASSWDCTEKLPRLADLYRSFNIQVTREMFLSTEAETARCGLIEIGAESGFVLAWVCCEYMLRPHSTMLLEGLSTQKSLKCWECAVDRPATKAKI